MGAIEGKQEAKARKVTAVVLGVENESRNLRVVQSVHNLATLYPTNAKGFIRSGRPRSDFRNQVLISP
jgi:hypothetical protein